MSAIEGLRGIRTDRRHRDHGWKDTRPSPSLGTAHLSASKTGLVLVGGGARGAYQAGVLQGLAEIVGERFGDRPPFDVVTGISAGAINAAYLASRADRMAEASAGLAALWGELRIDRVMRTDAVSLFSIGTRWLRDLTLGGLLKPDARSNHLLDTTPLREFLIANIDFEAIARHIASDILHGFAVSATSYTTGTAVTFFDGASIPILFRPVFVEGAFYGDGGVGMATPLSPAIHLGADRVVAISVRHSPDRDSNVHVNYVGHDQGDISIADIAGVMLNAAFMDALDSDAERLIRINHTLTLIEERRRAEHPHWLRSIPLLVIRPSVDLGALAADQFSRLPATLRYLTRGIGASPERGADFVSYLAFDPSYTRPLIEIGRRDAVAQKDEIEAFFSSRPATCTPAAGGRHAS